MSSVTNGKSPCRNSLNSVGTKVASNRQVSLEIQSIAIQEYSLLCGYLRINSTKTGYLYKFKARLVVRGDLQTYWEDTYAATLAARHFRALVAIAATFGLLMFQADAANAFLNARVNR